MYDNKLSIDDFIGSTMAWSSYSAEKNQLLLKQVGFELLIVEEQLDKDEHHLWVLALKKIAHGVLEYELQKKKFLLTLEGYFQVIRLPKGISQYASWHPGGQVQQECAVRFYEKYPPALTTIRQEQFHLYVKYSVENGQQTSKERLSHFHHDLPGRVSELYEANGSLHSFNSHF